MPKTTIVKVQISLFSSDGEGHAMIYNEDKSIMFEQDTTEELIDEMDGADKKYFKARKSLTGKVILLDEVEWQDW